MVGDAEDRKRWEEVHSLQNAAAYFRKKALAEDTPQRERERWMEAADNAARQAYHLIA